MNDLELLKENEQYFVKDYDKTYETIKATLDKTLNTYLVITDDVELGVVKSIRTEIRKDLLKCKLLREQIYNETIATIDGQIKSFEKLIDNADKELKSRVEEYVDKNTPKKITLEIKSYDMAKINELKAFAESLGVEAKVK